MTGKAKNQNASQRKILIPAKEKPQNVTIGTTEDVNQTSSIKEKDVKLDLNQVVSGIKDKLPPGASLTLGTGVASGVSEFKEYSGRGLMAALPEDEEPKRAEAAGKLQTPLRITRSAGNESHDTPSSSGTKRPKKSVSKAKKSSPKEENTQTVSEITGSVQELNPNTDAPGGEEQSDQDPQENEELVIGDQNVETDDHFFLISDEQLLELCYQVETKTEIEIGTITANWMKNQNLTPNFSILEAVNSMSISAGNYRSTISRLLKGYRGLGLSSNRLESTILGVTSSVVEMEGRVMQVRSKEISDLRRDQFQQLLTSASKIEDFTQFVSSLQKSILSSAEQLTKALAIHGQKLDKRPLITEGHKAVWSQGSSPSPSTTTPTSISFNSTPTPTRPESPVPRNMLLESAKSVKKPSGNIVTTFQLPSGGGTKYVTFSTSQNSLFVDPFFKCWPGIEDAIVTDNSTSYRGEFVVQEICKRAGISPVQYPQ